jgi:hypothetical protein
MRVNLATGYWVATGHNPYIAQDLSTVFHNPLFHDFSTIGYPPPWALILGLIYRCAHWVFPEFLFYNFVIKIPIITANICLAYFVAHLLKKLGVEALTVKKARNFMLLNPLILVCSTAWGQIDSLVALISLAAVVLLAADKLIISAIMLALAISLKPIALPLAPVVFIFLLSKKPWKILWFFSVFLGGVIIFCVLPFIIFNWDPTVIFKNWNAHFIVTGCMSIMSISEIWNKSFQITGSWRVLGMLWGPATLGFTLYCLKFKIAGLKELLKLCTVMILVFFLTRSWVSEPNVLLLLPFILMLNSLGELDRISFTLMWTLPLGFSFFNGSLIALLFPSMPGVMVDLIRKIDTYRIVRLTIRTMVMLSWFLTAWWIVLRSCKNGALSKTPSPEDGVKEVKG